MSCPSKFIDYLDSFQKEESHPPYHYYTLFRVIHLHYMENQYGVHTYSGEYRSPVSRPPPTKPIPGSCFLPYPRSVQGSAPYQGSVQGSAPYREIDVSPVHSIQDLLDLIDKNPVEEGYTYNIQLAALSNIREELAAIQSMVGMKQLKCNVIDQLLYFIQGLHVGTGDFKHTVIYGPPGTGKTEVAKLIGKMYSKIGILSNKNIFKKVCRSDLVAGYLGQTAIKTKAVIQECLGGVLFIDEAYSLGNANDLDGFSRECIDTLCEALSDHKDDLMVIIAGYEKELDLHFFGANAGLNSRFIWRFTIDSYSASEMGEMFCKKVREIDWSMDTDIGSAWFEKHKPDFSHFGRDMERLLLYVKISHSKRVFGKAPEMIRKLTTEDMNAGMAMFRIHRHKSNDSSIRREILTSMYV